MVVYAWASENSLETAAVTEEKSKYMQYKSNIMRNTKIFEVKKTAMICTEVIVLVIVMCDSVFRHRLTMSTLTPIWPIFRLIERKYKTMLDVTMMDITKTSVLIIFPL